MSHDLWLKVFYCLLNAKQSLAFTADLLLLLQISPGWPLLTTVNSTQMSSHQRDFSSHAIKAAIPLGHFLPYYPFYFPHSTKVDLFVSWFIIIFLP